MSSPVFAGQLCATHINEWITHPRLDPALKWWLAELCHGEKHRTVKLLCKGVDYDRPADGRRGALPKTIAILRLEPDEIVEFAVR